MLLALVADAAAVGAVGGMDRDSSRSGLWFSFRTSSPSSQFATWRRPACIGRYRWMSRTCRRARPHLATGQIGWPEGKALRWPGATGPRSFQPWTLVAKQRRSARNQYIAAPRRSARQPRSRGSICTSTISGFGPSPSGCSTGRPLQL